MPGKVNRIIHNIIEKKGIPILAGVFVALVIMESVSELRARKGNRTQRTAINGLFSVPGFVALRFLLLPSMVWIAYRNREWRAGLTCHLPLRQGKKNAIAFFLLDYSNYLWHVLNHRIKILWRFHLVHHTDVDLDVTTAIRFHAGEMVTSVFYRGLAVLLTGASPLLVLIYEIFFEAATQFHHSNWKLPLRTEKILNKLVVTPRMHGIHHSIIRQETDSNYSVIFSFWDRIHRTINLHIPQDAIVTGVPVYANPDELTLAYLLKLPFTRIRKWEADTPSRGWENRNVLKA